MNALIFYPISVLFPLEKGKILRKKSIEDENGWLMADGLMA